MNHSTTMATLRQAFGHLQAGETDQARSLCLSVLDNTPGDPNALSLLGRICTREGDDASAATCLMQAVQNKPDDANLNYQLGTILGKLDRFDEAIHFLRLAHQYDPGHWRALNILGLALYHSDRLDEALECYRRSIAINPGHAATYSNMADTLKYKGEIDLAVENYQKALQLDPTLYSTYHALAFCRRFEKNDDSINIMEEILAAPDISGEQKMHIDYALAKAYEDIGEFDKSFAHLDQANKIKRSTFDFNIEDVIKVLNKPIRLFGPEIFDKFSHQGCPDNTPIFIVGMPRSGSTLVEQILASHPDVHGAGEIHDFNKVLEEHGLNIFRDEFDQGVAGLTASQLKTIGERYLQGLRQYSLNSLHITDKFLQNFLLLGLIRLALPNARIIHCIRDPVDTCLSCYKQLFRKFHLYSYDLAELGQYYRHYERLMAHWRTVIPGSFLDFHYEELINDQRGQTARLLEYCGLEWDDACLNYHKTERAVKTASDSQVRKSIYTSSVKRWKCYEAHLQPLLDALDYQGRSNDQPDHDGGRRNTHHSETGTALQQALEYLQQGKIDNARSLCLSIIAAEPDNPGASSLLGNISLYDGDAATAVEYYRKACHAWPQDANLNYQLGVAHGMMERYDDAIGYFRTALQYQPEHWRALQMLGQALHHAGRLDEALDCYRQSISINPDHAAAYSNMADTLKFMGDIDAAVHNYRRALQLDPGRYSTYRALASCKHFTKNDDDIKTMEDILNRPDMTGEQKMHVNYALAKAYEDTGDFDHSFARLHEANAFKRSTFDFSIDDLIRVLNKPTRLFGPEIFDKFSHQGCPDATPIFIVGMPRSGSTLVEQILASHPDVHGAGEIPDFNRVLEQHGLPDISRDSFAQSLSGLTGGQLRKIGEQYIQRIKQYSAGSTRITDKYLPNFLLLGMIRLALPNARIIHCIRNPVDTCLSCYKRLFTTAHLYSYDLAELGRYYRQYESLMAHWRTVIPGRFLDFHYEALINDQRGQTARLLEYCGLEWDDACLDYHKTERAVRTASNSQVRKSIYNSSVERWKRYEKHLQPLLAALQYSA